MKKKKIISFILTIVLLFSNMFFNFSNVYAKETTIYPVLKVKYNDSKNGNLSIINKLDEERKSAESFTSENGKFYILDSINKKVLIFNNKTFEKSINLKIENPLDLIISNNKLYILDNEQTVYELNLNGEIQSKKTLNIGNEVNPKLSKDKNGNIYLSNIKVSDGSLTEFTFGYKLEPSSKNKTKFVNLVSEKNNKNIEISFSHENGGTDILTSDKNGNIYVLSKDISIGKKIDFYQRTIYKININGDIIGKYIIPNEASYTSTYNNISIDKDGNIFYMYTDIDGIKIYNLEKESKNLLSKAEDTINNFFVTKADAISRQEAQDRAYKMAELKWHYTKSKNGNVIENVTELPAQFTNVTESDEQGIPYCWGGSDGLDSSSNTSKWSNFTDAISKGALAGNMYCSGGYKSSTAGLDCSGFVQNVLKIPGSKLGTWTLAGNDPNGKPYLISIRYDQLKSMDILLDVQEHVVFFLSWMYDSNGGRIGANTIEETGGNKDGSGQKVKKYYRTLDELNNGYGDDDGYAAERYSKMDSDFIESNSAQPEICSPNIVQIKDENINFNWRFKDTHSNGYQVAYRIRLYQGSINSTSQSTGRLIYEIGDNSDVSYVSQDLSDLQEGLYYWTLETKNNSGYWSSPIVSPVIITSDLTKSYSQTAFTSYDRLGGKNRYETSKIIADSFISGQSTQLDNVIIATGNDFPDSLAGATLSKKYNAPILLVDSSPNDSSQPALDYINKNLKKEGHIYILGGNGVIKDSFIDYFINQGFNKSNIVRISGDNRNQTSVQIANMLNTNIGAPVILAVDNNFPDALSISSAAGINGWPILLTSTNELNADVKNYLTSKKPSKVFIVGGTGVISDDVKDDVKETLGCNDDQIIRLSGSNRFETSKIINGYFFKNTSNPYFATGLDFPDALSGTSLAIKSNNPIILIAGSNCNQAADYIKSVSAKGIQFTIFGSYGVVSDKTVSDFLKLCK
ncbi:MAG: cell wall-binding repeat-containing protein [Bacillota bacterium]|nr:cell wall-binding repeat-containing protein [Bacillota bacterium]